MRTSWIRLGLPIVLLLAGAVAAGGLAWREAERARATERVLVRDYAAFIADRFARLSAEYYKAFAGITDSGYHSESPMGTLRAYASERARKAAAEMPAPRQPAIDYFFFMEIASRELVFSGQMPPEPEKKALRDVLLDLKVQCSPNDLIPFGRLAAPAPRVAPLALEFLWSALMETDGLGMIRRVYGFRLKPDFAVKDTG